MSTTRTLRAGTGRQEPTYTTGDHGTSSVRWSTYRDWQAANRTAAEAVGESSYRSAFLAVIASFAAKANCHERVSVSWWHSPYLYVSVTDDRLEYPYSGRALVSFDLTNGKWAGWDSERRYAYARRGWHAFLTRIAHYGVPAYGEESGKARAARLAAAEAFALKGHHCSGAECVICAAEATP